MYLVVAIMLQTAAVPERVAVPADRNRPRLSYRLDQAARPTASRAGARSPIDWDGLDQSLAGPAQRESRATPAARREQRWRGVPVVIVDGKVHGLW